MGASGDGEESELAENLAETPTAVAEGTEVGHVEGLIWSDATGVDVLSIMIRSGPVAVPVRGESWRHVGIVDLNMNTDEVFSAPRLRDLAARGGITAVEVVSSHFSLPLAGPPPGPWTGPLPPWWDDPKTGVIEPGDGPKPVVG
jgi:hypothetical protein